MTTNIDDWTRYHLRVTYEALVSTADMLELGLTPTPGKMYHRVTWVEGEYVRALTADIAEADLRHRADLEGWDVKSIETAVVMP